MCSMTLILKNKTYGLASIESLYKDFVTVCMSCSNPNHVLQQWFSLLLHDDGPGFRLNDSLDVKL